MVLTSPLHARRSAYGRSPAGGQRARRGREARVMVRGWRDGRTAAPRGEWKKGKPDDEAERLHAPADSHMTIHRRGPAGRLQAIPCTTTHIASLSHSPHPRAARGGAQRGKRARCWPRHGRLRRPESRSSSSACSVPRSTGPERPSSSRTAGAVHGTLYDGARRARRAPQHKQGHVTLSHH